MNQPSSQTAKLLLQLIKKTSLPTLLEKQNEKKGA
jgi:hypothetical protein